MRTTTLALLIATLGTPAAFAQQGPDNPAFDTPRADIALGYEYTSANAPPGGCKCFGMMGAFASGSIHVNDWLSFAAEAKGGHANDISMLGQNLTLITFAGGPRISYPNHRFVPYGQFLFGEARASDSYFPTGTTSSPTASSWMVNTGGGLDINLTHRIAIRAVDVSFLRTQFPNGNNNAENHLQVGAGIVIKFGGRDSLRHSTRVSTDIKGAIAYSCSTDLTSLDQGDTLEVIGNAATTPDNFEIEYRWNTTGGAIEGSGRRITVNTAGLAEGDYRITGHVASVSNPAITAQCDAPFHVRSHAEKVQTSVVVTAPTGPTPDEIARQDKDFHDNVPDALFDFDSYQIRPDALPIVKHAAEYLNSHPEIRVLVEGYADDRGSAEYNLALGQQRANAARESLIAAGIDPERIQIVSYGKEIQVCKAGNEVCWQQNRRAAFSMHH